jgi:tetratricopeptide (TPR) repeat protein
MIDRRIRFKIARVSSSSPNALQAAVNCLRQGRMTEAETLCRQFLGQRPNDFDALHLLGLIAAQTGRSEWAVDLLERAIRQRNDVAPVYNNLGNALRDSKRAEEAVVQYSRALALRPGFAEAHLGRSAVLLDLHRPAQSLADADAAIALRPGSALGHLNRGAALHELKRCALALASLDTALTLDPTSAAVRTARGFTQLDLNEVEAAAASFRSALGLLANDARAHYGLAVALQRLGLAADAARSAEVAIALDPSMAAAHNLHAATLMELLRPREALASAERAIEIQPDYAQAYVNRAGALLDLQKAADAIHSADQAIALHPQLASAHVNRGIALQALMRPAEALASLEQAARLEPDSVEAHFNQALCHLQLGDYRPGFRLYEWRSRIGRQSVPRGPALWTGREPIAGKTIVLRAEQGLGDTVQFCRFAKVVEQLGARPVLSVQRDLREVLRSLGPSIEVVDEDDERPADFQCPLASVVQALNLSLSDIPAAVPYLSGDPARIRHWRARLGDDGYKVGICWQGSRNKIDLGRSIPLQQFAALAQIPGVRLISLQKGYGTEQLASLPPQLQVEVPVEGMGPEALLDLVAVISNLNLVLTSDTLVAHLAGALAVPTWIALKQAPDWRWMLEREDSPWYPTVRLFRQLRSGDWGGVLADMRAALLSARGSRC